MNNSIITSLKKTVEGFSLDSLLKNQRLVIFLVCLVMASIMWLLNALSKNYTTSITYPVRYVNLPENKFIINDPPKQLDLRVNGHGFTLLRHKMRLAFTPVALDITTILNEKGIQSRGGYTIVPSTILDRISGQVSSDLQILDVKPEGISLVFDSLEVRMVPVKPNVDIQFRSRFDLSGNITTRPSTVEITGPRAIVEDIDTIYTRRRLLKSVDEDIVKDISLIIPNEISTKTEKVTLFIPVDEFTEKSFQVPIRIDSLPPDRMVRLFPQEVTLHFSAGLKQYSSINPDSFDFYVKNSDLQSGHISLPVNTGKVPDGIKSLKIYPLHVEYLIEKR